MSMSLEHKIGNRLKSARLRAELSVSELAQMLAVPDQEVLSLEAGEVRFSARRVSQLAALLKLEVRWFFSDYPEGDPCFEEQGSMSRPAIKDLIAAARSKGLLGDLVNAHKQEQDLGARPEAA